MRDGAVGDLLVSVVIVTYNSRDDVSGCLDALLESDHRDLEVIVVDNASGDGTAELVAASFPSVRLIRNATNLGFAAGNNLGFRAARGDILLVLNPDVRLRPDALRGLVTAFAQDPLLGVAGCKLLFPDGRTVQHAGGVVEYPLATARHRGYGEPDNGQWDEPAEVPFVTGAALALRREALRAAGGFDPGFFPVYYEDTDLCYRARAAGWRVVYVPAAVGLHRTSASLDQASPTYFTYYHMSRLRFVLKHYSTQQLIDDFLPAEAARLRGEMPGADRAGSEQAYRQQWEGVMGTLASDQAQVREAIAALREEARKERERAQALRSLLADAEKRWNVQERAFVSRLPVVGRLVVAIREAWNSVSTKWYVRPILQQQVEFNAAVVRALAEVARESGALETPAIAYAAVLGQRLRLMEERIDQRLTTMEERLAGIEASLSELRGRSP